MWAMVLGRCTAGAVALVVAAGGGLVAAPGLAAVAAPAGGASGVGAVAAALAQARRTGEPVEVVDLHTEFETARAHPDGTLESELSPTRRRVRVGEQWRALDLTLTRLPDGSVGPAVAASGVRFSGGGGADALLRMDVAGHQLALRWPQALPEPVLEGDTAVYRDVVPGADLRLTATPEGYDYAMVVRTASARKHPLVASTRLGLDARGLTVGVDESGGLTATADGTEPVIAGETGLAWVAGDSAGPAAFAPPAGAEVAPVALQVTGGEVRMSPDWAALGEDAYPVVLRAGSSQGIAAGVSKYLQSRWPKEKHNHFGGHAGVGWCARAIDNCGKGTPYENRMYFRFRVDAKTWRARDILDVQFKIHQVHAYSCGSTRAVNLYRVDVKGNKKKKYVPLTANTTWKNQPRLLSKLGFQKQKYGCDRNNPPGWLQRWEKSGKGRDRVESAFADAVKRGQDLGFALWAHNRKDRFGWKRFDGSRSKDGKTNVVLSVRYNTRPDKPTGSRLLNPDRACVAGAQRPAIASLTPSMRVLNWDVDKGDHIYTLFRMAQINPGTGAVIRDLPALKAPAQSRPKGRTEFTVAVPAGRLANGGTYRWWAVSHDGAAEGRPSDACEFAVDMDRPNVAPKVESEDFPVAGGKLKAGQLGRFVFDINGVVDPKTGAADITHFVWGLNNPVPGQPLGLPAGASSVELSVTPWGYGRNTLWVASVDKAGNRSPAHPYTFLVEPSCAKPGNDCPVTAFDLDATSGDVAVDTGAGKRNLDVEDGKWVPGTQAPAVPSDMALRLGGKNAFATGRPSVDTSQAFTATAWVKLDAAGLQSDATILAQTGEHANGLRLGYGARKKQWLLTHDHADRAKGSTVVVAAAPESAPVVAGKWTHLAGVYDTGTGLLTLYVDGVDRASQPYQGAWNADEELYLGRAMVAGQVGTNLAGALDDVRLYQGPLSGSEIRQLIERTAPPATR